MKTLALTCILPQLGHAAPVYLGNTYVGSIHSLNTVRPDEPECIQYYGKNATGTATGASWDDPLHALNDVLDWHTGRDPKPKEVMYGSHLPEVTTVSVLGAKDIWKPYSPSVKLNKHCYYWIYNTAAGIVQIGLYMGQGTDADALWSTSVGTIYNRYVSHYSEEGTQPAPPMRTLEPAYWQGPALAGTNDCWDDE